MMVITAKCKHDQFRCAARSVKENPVSDLAGQQHWGTQNTQVSLYHKKINMASLSSNCRLLTVFFAGVVLSNVWGSYSRSFRGLALEYSHIQ